MKHHIEYMIQLCISIAVVNESYIYCVYVYSYVCGIAIVNESYIWSTICVQLLLYSIAVVNEISIVVLIDVAICYNWLLEVEDEGCPMV